ncbi:MAG: DUF6445 family protein [Cellvibrio sp.]
MHSLYVEDNLNLVYKETEDSGDEINTGFNFSINPDVEITTLYVGNEQEPVVIVDNLLKHPEDLIRYAETGAAFQKETKDFYPGIRKSLTPDYAEAIYHQLTQTMGTVFGKKTTVNIKLLSSLLSLATTRTAELRPIQSVPHADSFLSNNIASVHYLCDSQFGGTSFYRHRSTGFETLNSQRIQQYAPKIKSEVMQLNKTSYEYINGDTELFERIASVDAKFNRAIFYRSNILHSANIPSNIYLGVRPKTGRLTANTLIVID